MKKTSFLAVIAVLFSALFALALGTSCDTGGGGGGGGGGGNSSSQNSSTSVTVTIPKSASSSSDINLLGEFYVADTAGFSYGVWFESTDGKTKVDEQFASAGGTITFSNVKYARYNFYLKIYVDGRHKTVLNTLSIMNNGCPQMAGLCSLWSLRDPGWSGGRHLKCPWLPCRGI